MSMDSNSVSFDLKASRTLAHKLFEQCRKSSGSYKLLAGSVKELRNVLEDLEDFFEDPSSTGASDSQLFDRIARSRSLLEQLATSIASPEDATESTVADFKTALDSIRKELQLSEDAISPEDISSRLDGETRSAAVPPSTSMGSASASARDSSHGLRPSSRTSSQQSLVRQDSTRYKSADMNHLVPSWDDFRERRPSQEKEVYVPGAAYLTPIPSNREDTARARSSSIGWNSPFQDPMSISIEQASSMILRDDEYSPTVLSRPRSRTGPVTSTTLRSFDHFADGIPPTTTALGISVYDHGRLQSETSLHSERSRAHSVSTPLVGSEPVARGITPPVPSCGQKPNVHSTASTESLKQIDSGHLSPNFAARGAIRTSRANSNSSITFSTKSIEEYPASEEVRRSAESFRDELSAVIDDAFGDHNDRESVRGQTETIVSETPSPSSTVNFQSPPTRRPPSPPRKRAVPRIPKRSSTYRIVNGELPDDSSTSDEEDLYSTSKPSSPVATSSPRFEFVEPSSDDRTNNELPSAETPNTKDSVSNTSSSRRPRHAEQVLMTRAAYASPRQDLTFGSDGDRKAPTLKLPNSSSSPEGNPKDQSPRLKRHSTSTGSPNEPRLVAATGSDQLNNHRIPATLEQAATKHPQQRPTIGNQDSSAAHSQQGPLLPPRPILRAPSGKETAVEPGLEIGKEGPSTVPQVASRSLSVSSKVPNVKTDYKEWYAPGEEPEVTEVSQLDQERINHIIHFWNGCLWDDAQRYLEAYLASLLEQDQLDRARRVRHLIGVCMSFQGLWRAAIPCFLSVMRTPIQDVFGVDDGDCAAAHWMGDCHSLLNERTEAMLAYCIAERSSLFQDDQNPRLSECILAEQETVRLGISKAHFEAQWAQESLSEHQGSPQSILDSRIVSETAARSILEHGPRRNWGDISTGSLYNFAFRLDQNQSRAHAFVDLDRLNRIGKFHNMKLTAANFNPHPKAPWPLIYDPFFTMANVRRGRLLRYECDLIAVFNSNSDAKIPKSSSTALGRMDCFTATDLNWLINTIRKSLRMLEMDWSEIANVEGTWFVVRYSFMQTRIATTYYFSISLFRQSFRAGYGVDICPDGICSSRIVRADWEHVKGVHISESKRIKKLIRDLLDEAARSEAPPKREPSTVQTGSKGVGRGIIGKSFATFRQRKRTGEREPLHDLD